MRSMQRHGPFRVSDLITTGLDPASHGWEKVKGMFETEYTIFAGLIASVFITMGTQRTDQDMVQRMLTAPDISPQPPFASSVSIISPARPTSSRVHVLSIGLLLWVYYQPIDSNVVQNA